MCLPSCAVVTAVLQHLKHVLDGRANQLDILVEFIKLYLRDTMNIHKTFQRLSMLKSSSELLIVLLF